MINKRIISIFELILIVLSTVAFSYFMSTNLPGVFEKESSAIQFLVRPIMPSVSAAEITSSGCCKETVDNAICQEIKLVDKNLCKTGLIGTSCKFTNECQRGCCYDYDSGICSMKAPKEACISGGGKWDESETCNIPECQVGCCILGDGASITTTRECTQLSNEYNMAKSFKPLDSKGSCDSYAELNDLGACLTPANDYSNKNDCAFTEKRNCVRSGQIFKKGYLCTSKELNTTCQKTEKTTCNGDKVYFIDSCGNNANVYDSALSKNDSYWSKIIPSKQSCIGASENCGNCNYVDGSVCTKYFTGKGLTKPTLGNYVCKNLDCAGGRKHGESWCISDADNSKNISNSVGTRNYVATCFEGEIKLEGCADFNQEICIENKDTKTKKSEAMCTTNDWRSCIYANDANSYSEIKIKCDQLPQCVMFNDIPGNEKYKDLPGFKETLNSYQGKAGDVGDNMNDIVTHCVPRFTPGYQFWTSASASNPFSGKIESSASYGGSESETNSLCDLGTFTCVSHIETTSSIAGGSSKEDKENPECNWQAVSQSNQKVSLMMDGLNERCRMLGSCGLQYNMQGELARSGFDVNRIHIDKKGDLNKGYTTEGYNVSEKYLDELKDKQSGVVIGTKKTLLELTNWKNGASLLTSFGSQFSSSGSMTNPSYTNDVTRDDQSNSLSSIMGGVTALAGVGLMLSSGTTSGAMASGAGTASAGAGYGLLATAAVAAAAFTLGSLIGTMMSKGQPPGEAAVTTAAWAGGVTAVVMGTVAGFAIAAQMTTVAATATTAAYSGVGFGSALLGGGAGAGTGFATTVCFFPIVCLAIVIAAVIYALFTTGTDHDYYVTEFKCEAWQPPLVGKCEECNYDVRACSEFKCRSIGNNCHYFIENGEPGYCATLADVWSAKIEPWKEVITTENTYENISSFGFRIENKRNEDNRVDAWKQLTFGIITDKEAECRIDINHSLTFDQMRFAMKVEQDPASGKIDGKHHKMALSPYAVLDNSEEDIGTTIPLEEGENNYYIKCQNYAGLTNDAPFVVQVNQLDGPDLTPPIITRFAPNRSGYLAQNSTKLNLFVYLNEPAECKYSFDQFTMNTESSENSSAVSIMNTIPTESDIIVTDNYQPFTEISNDGSVKMSCITGATMGFYGEWLCAAFIDNYSSNQQIFIECKDQPGLIEEEFKKRNVVREEYSAQICDTGLSITSVTPIGNVEVTSNDSVVLKIETAGCINSGESSCSFRLPYYGDSYSLMFNTGKNIHSQSFNYLGEGTRNVDIKCEDIAGNVAEKSINFTVFVDNDAPKVTRAYVDSNTLIITTDEEAECLFVKNNASIGCDFGYEQAMKKYSINHVLTINESSKDTFYIKCIDDKGNGPLNECTETLKLSDLQQ